MADYTYTCPNAGHQGDREFIAADPGWFADRGLDTPVSCKPCRDWMQAQRDENWQCAACGKHRKFTAAYKEAFHRSQGKFVLPEVCGEACAKKLEQRRLAEQRRLEAERRCQEQAAQKYALQSLLQSLEEHKTSIERAPEPEGVEQDEELESKEVGSFKELPDGFALPQCKVNLKLSPARRRHIERHLPALGGTRSPSALVDAQASLDDMIAEIGWVATQTQLPKRVFWQPKGERYICLTEIEDGRIEVTVLAERQRSLLANKLEPITSYDGVGLKYVTDRLADGRWSG